MKALAIALLLVSICVLGLVIYSFHIHDVKNTYIEYINSNVIDKIKPPIQKILLETDERVRKKAFEMLFADVLRDNALVKNIKLVDSVVVKGERVCEEETMVVFARDSRHYISFFVSDRIFEITIDSDIYRDIKVKSLLKAIGLFVIIASILILLFIAISGAFKKDISRDTTLDDITSIDSIEYVRNRLPDYLYHEMRVNDFKIVILTKDGAFEVVENGVIPFEDRYVVAKLRDKDIFQIRQSLNECIIISVKNHGLSVGGMIFYRDLPFNKNEIETLYNLSKAVVRIAQMQLF